MFKRKKFIIAAALAAVVLAATFGGVALAANGDDDTPRPAQTQLMEKVAEIYQQNTGIALDTEALQQSFIQAQQQLGTQARQQLEQRLIDEGIVTQEQLDALQAWLEARPNARLSDEFKAWLEARPDVGGLPHFQMERFGFGGGQGGPGQRHGFGFGFGPPDDTAQ